MNLQIMSHRQGCYKITTSPLALLHSHLYKTKNFASLEQISSQIMEYEFSFSVCIIVAKFKRQYNLGKCQVTSIQCPF